MSNRTLAPTILLITIFFLSSHPKRRSKIKWSKGEKKTGIKTHIFLLFNQFFCCVAQALGAKERAHETEKVQWRSKLFMELVQYENLFKDITFLIGEPCSSWERDGTSPMTRLMWFFGVKTDDEGEDDARVRWCVYLNGCKNWGEWWRESSRSVRWWWWDISPRVERP